MDEWIYAIVNLKRSHYRTEGNKPKPLHTLYVTLPQMITDIQKTVKYIVHRKMSKNTA